MEPCDATYDFGNLDTVAIRRRKRPELGHGVTRVGGAYLQRLIQEDFNTLQALSG